MAHICYWVAMRCAMCVWLFCHRYLTRRDAPHSFRSLSKISLVSLGLAVHGALPALHKIRKGRSFHFAIFITFTVWIIHLSVAARISHFSFFLSLSLPHLIRALHERCCECDGPSQHFSCNFILRVWCDCIQHKSTKSSMACIMPHSAQIKRRSKPKKSTPHFCCWVHGGTKKLFSFALQLNRWNSYCTSINYFMVPAHVKRVLFSLICFLGHNDDAWEISFLYIPIHKGTHFALYLCVLRAAERRAVGKFLPLSACWPPQTDIKLLWWCETNKQRALISQRTLCLWCVWTCVFTPAGRTLRGTQRCVRCALLAEGWNDDDNNIHFLLNRSTSGWRTLIRKLVVNHSTRMIILFVRNKSSSV